MPTDADPIPIRTSLSEIYSSSVLLSQGKRWDSLAQKFEQTYGHAPEYIVRAPGRVNVIGVRSPFLFCFR